MSKQEKQGFDYTTLLLLIVMVVCIVGMFFSPVESPVFDWDEASAPLEIYFHNVRPECYLTGVDSGYTGEVLVIESDYRKNGEKYTLKGIYDNFLEGTNVRHIKMSRIPEEVSPDAFAGVEDVIVYTDHYTEQAVKENMEWAKNVTIRTSEDFSKLIDPKVSYQFEFSIEQLKNTVKHWSEDEWLMLRLTIPLSLIMFVLCFLRQKNGRGNPLWPVFRSGIRKWLFVGFSVVVGLMMALTMFGEEADIGLDTYAIVEFMMGWPVKALAVVAGLILISDLIAGDFPWFIARWVVRITITTLVIMICAGIGWVAATIVTENEGLFKALYIGGLALGLSILVGGGGKVNQVVMKNTESSTVITENGSSMRVDHFSHGTYVGNDQIVGFGSTTMTGVSGQVYKKW